MLAARLEEGGLRITDVPTPEPEAGEARVRISAAGVCHSDLHLARGDWAGIPAVGALGSRGDRRRRGRRCRRGALRLRR